MPTPENLATDATVAIMLADGFETVEALAVADILFRAGVRTDLISVTDARHVTSSHGIRVVADLMLEDVDLSTYTVLFLPGGLPGTTNLKATPAIQAEVLRRADMFESHQVTREALSTRERMSEVLERLKGGGFVPFVALFHVEEGRLGVVVTFMAVLELIKESLVELVQNEPFAPIHVRSRTE